MNTKLLLRIGLGLHLALLIILNTGCATIATPATSRQLQAEIMNIPEANCSINIRRVSEASYTTGPLFIAVNGVPTTALIYAPLAESLVENLNATVLLVDLPGTGASRIDDGHYNWTTQRECLRAFLLQQPQHTLIVHDAAEPVLLPILAELPMLKNIVVFNTLLKPSTYSLPFPLHCLRSCLFLSKPLAYAAPFWFYENRFRAIGLAHNEGISQQQIRLIYTDLQQDHGMGRLVDVLQGFELNTPSDLAISTGLNDTRPQQFIWGMQDPALGAELEHLKTDKFNRKLYTLAQARHFPMLDFSAESATAIAAWYRQLP